MSHRPTTLQHHRRGLTLVEMMVSVALTLMVVFALVQVFELLGDNVTDGRATMEMSGNLSGAAQLLRDDLQGLTVTTLPPRDPEQGEGYLEIVDGPSTDSQHLVQSHSGGVPGQLQMVSLALPSFADVDGDGFLDASDVPFDTSVGDVDDVLAFTMRRTDQPFTGEITDTRIKLKGAGGNSTFATPWNVTPTRILESIEAEVVWWLQIERNQYVTDLATIGGMAIPQQIANATSEIGSQGISSEADRALAAQRYPNQTGSTLGTPVRSLHRRVLLIRPDLDLSGIVLKGYDELAAFLSNNDISVRVIRPGEAPTFRVEANSLGDLTVRNNRAYRLGPVRFRVGLAIREMPASSRLSDDRDNNGELLSSGSHLLRHATMKDMVLTNNLGTQVIMMRKGKDIVLSDVLAFDLQVWDPHAIVKIAADGTAVSPSDPGYINAPAVVAAQGTYVDLGFGIAPKAQLPLPQLGFFGGQTHAKSDLPISPTNPRFSPIYCTWSSAYEYDGYDQDKKFAADQGTNGFDDDGNQGVDDPGEAETSPPYPYPLRGLSAKLRVMDFSTRQVRQTSVVKDFLPE